MSDEHVNGRGGGIWAGEGWQRTQRQLGVLLLGVAFVLETAATVDIPIILYSIIAWLLGLDVLVEALDRLRGGERK